MFGCALLYVYSSLAIILVGEMQVALLSLFPWCLVALPRDVMGLSAVCDCGIFGSYALNTFA